MYNAQNIFLDYINQVPIQCVSDQKNRVQFCVYCLSTCKLVKEFFFFFLLCLWALWAWTSFFFFVCSSFWWAVLSEGRYIQYMDFFCIWYVLYVDGIWYCLHFKMTNNALFVHLNYCIWIEYTYLVFQLASNDHSLHRSCCILWWWYTQFLYTFFVCTNSGIFNATVLEDDFCADKLFDLPSVGFYTAG